MTRDRFMRVRTERARSASDGPGHVGPSLALRASIAGLVALALFLPIVGAHPVGKDNHDRTITVRLRLGPRPETLLARVEYRLEVDEATVAFDDMKPFADEVNLLEYRGKAL